MKKIFGLMLVMMIAAFVMAGCGSSGDDAEKAEPEAITALKTMGDVATLEKEDNQVAVGEGKAVAAFKYEDTYYRVIADLTKDEEKAYIDVDILKKGAEEKQAKILEPIKITKVENLSEQIISQDDLDALKGKTGKELTEEGWKYQGSYMAEDNAASMDNGPFTYSVTFEGEIKGAEADDFDIEKATKDLKVKSIKFDMLGDATTLKQE